MALQCPTDFDQASLREQVRATYERVAQAPQEAYHFHRGAEYAADYLGYSRAELSGIPARATARFAGVGNPIDISDADPARPILRPGLTVLDHACGAGMDLLLAAGRVGPDGKAIGVDMTAAMCRAASDSASEAGMADWVEIRQGVYEALPVEDASVDVVLSNGVVNLAPDKVQVFSEIARVLKPGGYLLMADVIVQRELSLEVRSNPELWAACVGGALMESELNALAQQVGLVDGRVVKRFNCFYNTSAEDKVAKDLFVHSVNFVAAKAKLS